MNGFILYNLVSPFSTNVENMAHVSLNFFEGMEAYGLSINHMTGLGAGVPRKVMLTLSRPRLAARS